MEQEPAIGLQIGNLGPGLSKHRFHRLPALKHHQVPDLLALKGKECDLSYTVGDPEARYAGFKGKHCYPEIIQTDQLPLVSGKHIFRQRYVQHTISISCNLSVAVDHIISVLFSLMIVFTGEALIDFIPVRDAGGKRAYQPAPGGSPYNSSIAAARLDVPVQFFGGISHDFFGDTLAQNLQANGVDTELVKRSDNPTTLAFVDKNAAGEARYAFFANSAADRHITPEDLPKLGDSVTALAFGSIALLGEPSGSSIVQLVEASAQEYGPVISFDPNIRESLIRDEAAYRQRLGRCIAASTIVKVSDEDLTYIVPGSSLENAAQEILKQGPALVVVTAGAEGSRAFSRSGVAEASAEKTKVVDTIGAGDSFHAALLAWLFHSSLLSRDSIAALTDEQLSEMIRFAGAVAAKTCGSAGANPPRLAEVQTRFRFWGK